jgi:hypothetical protein
MIDPTLLNDAKCFVCLGVPLAAALKIVLLGRISEGSESLRITEDEIERATEDGQLRTIE